MKVEIEHIGKYKSKVEDFGYKTIIITGPIAGKDDLHFGRLIQVRKKSGAFGSDTVLLREADGKLQSYHNMGFFSVNEDYMELYENAMKEVDEKDVDDIEHAYDIVGQNPCTGFVINGLDDTNGAIYSLQITETRENNKINLKIS